MASSSKLESSPSLPLPLPATHREDRLSVRVLTKGNCRDFILILILRSVVGGGYKKLWSLFPFLCLNRREIIYCKRAILCLSSSKILTPHPPLRLASVSSPPQQMRGYTHTRRAERGMRGQYFGKTRDIGLPSYSK
jgi:hypothetical protein